jgi:CheY-like chemotaxis protein
MNQSDSASSTSDPQSKTILVVDDDKLTCAFFKNLLSSEGFEVKTAFSGRYAFNLLKTDSSRPLDLIILDLMMPKCSGYEVIKELQGEPEHRNIPVFVVTARTLDPGAVEMIRSESNVSGFWPKPVETQKFKSRIHEVLGTVPKPKSAAKCSFDLLEEVTRSERV